MAFMNKILIKHLMRSRRSRHGILSVHDFKALLVRERTRADRSGVDFSVLVFDSRMMPFKRKAAAMQRLIEEVRQRKRCTDEAGFFGINQVGLYLAETDAYGADFLAHDICTRLDLPMDCYTIYFYTPANGENDEEASKTESKDSQPSWSATDPVPDPTFELPQGARTPFEKPQDLSKPVETHKTGGAVGTMVRPSTRSERVRPKQRVRPNPPGALGLEWYFLHTLPAWKRALDVAGAAFLLLLFSPVMLLAALAIKITSPGPVIFRQQRVGKGGRPFTFYKFRSMVADAESQRDDLIEQNEQDGPIFKIRNDPRITPVGRLMRRTSIDELPQLWNVLKGDMSLVGPRPPTVDEVPKYHSWQRRRLDLTGGLTGLWQVSGRSNVGFEEWMRMDLNYIREKSFLLDLKLLLKTPIEVLRGRGAH
ncbi:MAG: sugar transferase [Planctomycetota bacterium]|jgi:lipopolysaccharide/colanic/teichoic acid biosynthesis glycosyltransferase